MKVKLSKSPFFNRFRNYVCVYVALYLSLLWYLFQELLFRDIGSKLLRNEKDAIFALFFQDMGYLMFCPTPSNQNLFLISISENSLSLPLFPVDTLVTVVIISQSFTTDIWKALSCSDYVSVVIIYTHHWETKSAGILKCYPATGKVHNLTISYKRKLLPGEGGYVVPPSVSLGA